MLNKFFKFLKGYVIIKLYGQGTERFLNICTRRNIEIGRVTAAEDGSAFAYVGKKDFHRLRPVARKTRTKVHIVKKKGLFDLKKRYRYRIAFFIGMLFFLAFFALVPKSIWSVEIDGVEDADITSIKNILYEEGIYPGARKKNISEISEIKQRLITENDDIAWAWVYIEGAKARVEIYEKVMPPMVADINTPCDIVAACDGYIKAVTLKNGEQLKNDGETVSAGETIISGKVPVYREGYEENYIYVHAMGIVEAYTWHTKEGDYKTYYESRIPTGKVKRRLTVEMFGKTLPLYINDEAPYETSDEENIRHELKLPIFGFTGISLDAKKYTEVNVIKEPLDLNAAIEFAKNDLEEKIAKELSKDPELIGEELQYEQLDPETVRVKLSMSFTEKIEIEKTLEESEFDKQTNRSGAGN